MVTLVVYRTIENGQFVLYGGRGDHNEVWVVMTHRRDTKGRWVQTPDTLHVGIKGKPDSVRTGLASLEDDEEAKWEELADSLEVPALEQLRNYVGEKSLRATKPL